MKAIVVLLAAMGVVVAAPTAHAGKRLTTGSSGVEARGLTRRYGNTIAVDHLGFSVCRREVFGFLGNFTAE